MELAKQLRDIMRSLLEGARAARDKKVLDEASIRRLIKAEALVHEVYTTMMVIGIIDPKEFEETEEELFRTLMPSEGEQ